MFTELRYYLTPRLLLAIVALVCALLLLVPQLPPYSQIGTFQQFRHLEARGRAPEQLQQQEAERQRAAQEEARGRQQQEAESRRKAEQDAAVAAKKEEKKKVEEEFNSLKDRYMKEKNTMLVAMEYQFQILAKNAYDPAYYRQWDISPEAASSNAACQDPAGTMAQLDSERRKEIRHRNIHICALYHTARAIELQLTDKLQGMQFIVTAALLYRLNDAQGIMARAAPLPTLLSYIWVHWHIGEALENWKEPPPLPPLTAGDQLNPRLFEGFLAPGFAERLFQTGSLEEKLAIRGRVYPDMVRLTALLKRWQGLCRELPPGSCKLIPKETPVASGSTSQPPQATGNQPHRAEGNRDHKKPPETKRQ